MNFTAVADTSRCSFQVLIDWAQKFSIAASWICWHIPTALACPGEHTEQPQLLPALWGPAGLKVLQLCPAIAIYFAESAASYAFPHQGNLILQGHPSCKYLICSVWLLVIHLLVMQNLLFLRVHHKFSGKNYYWGCKTFLLLLLFRILSLFCTATFNLGEGIITANIFKILFNQYFFKGVFGSMQKANQVFHYLLVFYIKIIV